MADNELGAYLRSRREAITPAEVGLPAGANRRTPGLRRSELATIAGLSVDYLIRLEQGRDRNPSASVVRALADALQLSHDERVHLKRLTAMTSHPELCPALTAPATEIRPAVRAVLDRLEPAPAVVINDLGDLIAWTDAYERIGGPLGILDARHPNFAHYTFCHPAARRCYPEWPLVADQQVANLRAVLPVDRPELVALVAELRTAGGHDFSSRWDARPVVRKATGSKRIDHPEVGPMRLLYETMQLSDDDGQRLVVYLPADEASGHALDALAGRRPGGLRTVPAPGEAAG